MSESRGTGARIDEGHWATYLQWNEWVADAFFVESTLDPLPVYLDFDGSAAERLAQASGCASPDDAAEALLEAVRSTLPLFGKQLFVAHSALLRSWASELRDALETGSTATIAAPPVLPLLLAFVLAAEQMKSDAEMGPSNYYGRLAKVLRRDVDDLRLSYQSSAERLWGALNAWLVELDGRLGLPSAYSISSYRYVGIAVSQALVREADRSRLPDFFEFADLAPNSDLPPEALEPLLRTWTASPHGGATKQLIRLVENERTLARVAEVASVELAAWQGTDGRDRNVARPQPNRPVVLRLQFAGMPIRKPRLTPVVRLRSELSIVPAELLAAGGIDVPVDLERLGAGTYAPPRSSVPAARELLQSRIRFRADGRVVERAPTPAIVFRADEFGIEHWETNTVIRGERLHVLVRAEFAAELEAVLAEVSPPTWTRKAYSELSADWTLYEGVEVLRPPSETMTSNTKWLADLLNPVTTHHLSLHDGFRMPGSVRQRWLSAAPPVVTASSDDVDGFTVTIDSIPDLLTSIDANAATPKRATVHRGTGTSSTPLILALEELDLVPGPYELTLASGSKGSSRQRRQFTLVAPRPRSTEAPVVGLDLAEPLSALERMPLESDRPRPPTDSPDGLLVGAAHFSEGGGDDGEIAEPANVRPWNKPVARPSKSRPSLDAAAPGSCFYTGAHRWHLETPPLDKKGRVAVQWSPGTCKTCGITKLFQNNAWKVNKKDAEAWRPTYVAIEASSKIDLDHDARLDLAIAALTVVGSGDAPTLRRILAQVDASALAVHRVIHDLTCVGILSVARDATTGDIVSWSIAPPTIVSTRAGSMLTSFWDGAAILEIHEAAQSSGSTIEFTSESLDSTLIRTTLDDDSLWAIAEQLDEGAFHAGAASCQIASSLPPLSQVLDRIPRSAMRHGGEFEQFDPFTASWAPSVGAARAGAFRTGTYSREYFIRTTMDVDSGRRALVDAATAKHASPLLAGAPPLLYREHRDGTLRTPLGTPLPGLYGRAAALAATQIPYSHRDEMVYESVDADMAGRLTYLLSN